MTFMMQPSVGQLERELSHRIGFLYSSQLGQRLSKIICHFFDKKLAITLENSVTPAEQTLINGGYEILAEEVRLDLDKIMKPQLKNLIEEVVGNPVLDLMGSTNLATSRTGIIVILKQLPDVRNPESIPKVKRKTLANEDGDEK
jgi:uncharacterized protein YbcI